MKIFIFLLGMAAMLNLASCASGPTTSTTTTTHETTVTQPTTTQQTTALRPGSGAPTIR